MRTRWRPFTRSGIVGVIGLVQEALGLVHEKNGLEAIGLVHRKNGLMHPRVAIQRHQPRMTVTRTSQDSTVVKEVSLAAWGQSLHQSLQHHIFCKLLRVQSLRQ